VTWSVIYQEDSIIGAHHSFANRNALREPSVIIKRVKGGRIHRGAGMQCQK
jgi:hypothetical protein